MAKLESPFQANLIKDLELLFQDCLIMKNDANYRQGIPDLLVLFRNRWALLEVKRAANERQQPNQKYYINWAQTNSFGAFIYPENRTEVLSALIDYFN